MTSSSHPLPRQEPRPGEHAERESAHVPLSEHFRKFARVTSDALGSAWAFTAAVAAVVIWAASGPLFGFSQNWQLVINTATTIVTFMMVFLLQNTQNRDSIAIHLKLDELLRGTQGPRTRLVHLEDLSDEELRHLQAEFQEIAADEELEDGSPDAAEMPRPVGNPQAGREH